MLQVVDELDDAVSVLRQCSIGIGADIGMLLAGGISAVAVGAVYLMGSPLL